MYSSGVLVCGFLLFFEGSFLVFVNTPSQNKLEMFPIFHIFLEEFEKDYNLFNHYKSIKVFILHDSVWAYCMFLDFVHFI